MNKFKDQETIERILYSLTLLLSSWGINPADWIVSNKFFFRPYLHDHPKSAYHQLLQIFLIKDKIPWQIKGEYTKQVIPPANSKYFKEFLDFMDNFVEIQFFPRSQKEFANIKKDCDLISIKDLNIQQVNILDQLTLAFYVYLKKNNLTKMILNEELALYVHLAYLHALKVGNIKLLKFIKPYYENRQSKVAVGGVINNIKIQGKVKFLFSNQDNSKIKEDDILVMKFSTNKHIPLMLKSKGVICEIGGAVGSHTAVICREFNLPGVVGVENIFDKFREGDLIEINPQDKCVYILKPYKII